MAAALALQRPAPVGALRASALPARSAARRTAFVVRAEDPKVVREYREDDDTVSVNQPGGAPQQRDPKALYADELPPEPRKELSKEMQARLRKEYLGLGGSANTAMGGNYFLYIIIGISFLAVLSWLTGAI